MRNPTIKQLDVVIKNLEKAFELAKHDAPVNMQQGTIKETKKNFCGTPMCHGGWYAIAIFNKLDDKNFSHGAEKIAEHLGFQNDNELENWAADNQEIWGNEHGDAMFISNWAFNNVNDSVFTLQTIIDHWKGVRERIAAL